MNIFIKKILFIFLIFSLFFTNAFAEVIYLKSGKSYEGKILKKNEKGDIEIDVNGVIYNFYKDEIYGIRSEKFSLKNNFYKFTMMDPKEVIKRYAEAMLKNDFQKMLYFYSSEYSKIMTERFNKIDMSKNKTIIKTFEVYDSKHYENNEVVYAYAKDPVSYWKVEYILVDENNQWKIHDEKWANADKDKNLIEKFFNKTSTISGSIKFPFFLKFGNLFILFYKTDNSGLFYKIIKPYEFNSIEIKYNFKNIPAGKYKGRATWDLKEPFWSKSWGEGNCPGLPGDYMDELDEFEIKPDENIKIDFILKEVIESQQENVFE